MRDIQSIISNAGYFFAARSVANVLRAAYVIVLARMLGPELYGLLAYGQSWYTVFVPLTSLGFAVLLAREAGQDRARGQALAVQILVLHRPLTLFAAALCAGIGWTINAEPAVRLLLGVFSLALIGRAIAVMADEIFAAFEISHLAFRQEAMFRPAEVGVGLAILVAGGGVLEIAILHAAIQIVQGMRGLALIRRHLAVLRGVSAWRPSGSVLVRGMLAGMAGLFSGWLLQGPLLIYAQVSTDKVSVGQLALVLQALVLLCNLPWAVGRSALPVLSRAKARDDGSSVRYADAMLRLAFILAAALGLAGMAIGPWLMVSVFGTGYSTAGTLLGPALWLLLPLTAATALNPLLMVRERYGAAGLSALAGAAVMAALVPVLATSMGPLGAIAGAGAGFSLWAMCLLGLVGRQKGVTIGLAIIRPGIVATIALFAYLTMQSTGAGPLWGLAVAWLILLLAGVGLCMVTAERRALVAVFAELWARTFRRAS